MAPAKPIRILVVGCGHMGTSHAKAYHALPGFEIVGVVARGEKSRRELLAALGADYPQFSDYGQALAATKPDAVSINTYPDTHADYAMRAFAAGRRTANSSSATCSASTPPGRSSSTWPARSGSRWSCG
jgi:predicted dehydrogenase